MFSSRKDSLWGFAYEVGAMKPLPQQARVPQLQQGQHPPSEGEGAILTGKEVTAVIHLQIERVGDFRPEFMSRACLTCFGTKLVGQKQPKPILLGQTIVLPIVDRRGCIKKERMGRAN